MSPKSAPTNVVLVHGGFVDGSGWQAVYKLLKKDGFNVELTKQAAGAMLSASTRALRPG